jgi:phosphatidylglycerophosphate synthase
MPNHAYQPADRRPMAARSWSVLRRLATWLSRRGMSPNLISLMGMAASLAAAGLLAATSARPENERILWLGTALLIVVRGLANLLDGMVAIESKRASPLGELFNEVPDRISDSAMLIGLGFANGGNPYLGCLAALAAVFTAYTRAVVKVAGAPQDYRGPMAKQHRMLVVVVVCVIGLMSPGFLHKRLEFVDLSAPAVALLIVIIGCALTVALRLHRAVAILRSRT